MEQREVRLDPEEVDVVLDVVEDRRLAGSRLLLHEPVAARFLARRQLGEGEPPVNRGEASLVADLAQPRGLDLPPIPPPAQVALHAVLGDKVALANPLDYHTYIWGDREALARVFAAMLAPHIAIGVAILDFPRPDRCDASAWEIVIDGLTAACSGALIDQKGETVGF